MPIVTSPCYLSLMTTWWLDSQGRSSQNKSEVEAVFFRLGSHMKTKYTALHWPRIQSQTPNQVKGKRTKTPSLSRKSVSVLQHKKEPMTWINVLGKPPLENALCHSILYKCTWNISKNWHSSKVVSTSIKKCISKSSNHSKVKILWNEIF